MPLSVEATELIWRAHESGVVHIWAHTIVPAAALIQAGYAAAGDDENGPWISLTEKGRHYISE